MKTWWLLGVALLWALPTVWAGTNSLARRFDQTAALTNLPITVTASFTNDGAVALRGFYYADQVPSGLVVTTLNVTVNGQIVTNYTFESGQDGDVYPGRTPYRWVLERPRNFTETNPIPPQAQAQIVYTIRSAAAGTFVLPAADWVGFDHVTTNAFFGSNQPPSSQTVNIFNVFPTGPLSLTITNQRVNLTFPTQSGVTYAAEYQDGSGAAIWQTLTNVIGTGDILLVVDPALMGSNRFYRIRIP